MTVTFRLKEMDYIEVVDDDGFTHHEPAELDLEVNMANTNAKDLLILLDRPRDAEELVGEWDVGTSEKILRKIIKLRNINNGAAFESKTVVEKNFVDVGRSLEYVHVKLDRMAVMLKEAIKRKQPVLFA